MIKDKILKNMNQKKMQRWKILRIKNCRR